MTYEIEYGIPMPDSGVRARTEKYPFSKLIVGASFFVPDRTTKNFQSTVTAAAKRLDVTFRCRAVDGGVRVWRTE